MHVVVFDDVLFAHGLGHTNGIRLLQHLVDGRRRTPALTLASLAIKQGNLLHVIAFGDVLFAHGSGRAALAIYCNTSLIAAAALRPSPMARITVAAPRTMSPPA